MNKLNGMIMLALFLIGCGTLSPSKTANNNIALYGTSICESSNFNPPPSIAPISDDDEKEVKITARLNDKPPNRIGYLGTTGYYGQDMRAIPDNQACPLGAKLILSRPLYEADRKFNSDCCAPGLKFSSNNSIEITGVPTDLGTYEKTILLCGVCSGSTNRSYRYPVEAKIKWQIKGKKPRRLE